MNLRERLKALRADRDARAKEIVALDAMISVLEEHVGDGADVADDRPKQHAARMAWEILKENGPLTANHIADLMIHRGYRTNAKNLVGPVYQRMWEARSWFKKTGRLWEAIGDKPPYERPSPSKMKRIR